MNKRLSFFYRRLLKNNPYYIYRLHAVKKNKELDTVKLEELRYMKFRKLVYKAYNSSVFYQNLYNEHGVDIHAIQDLRDLKQLPIITKEQVKKYTKDILTIHPKLCKKAYTSGTSGTPLMVYRDYTSTVEEEAYLWAHRNNFGHYLGENVVSLRAELKRDQFKVFDPFSKIMHLSSFKLSNQTAEAYYNEIREYAPKAMYAFPSAVEILANFLLERGWEMHIPHIFTSSETLYEFQRSKIEKVFNSRVVDWYGNAERSIALEENKEGTYDELPLYSINEFEEDRTITTGLINRSFPLIRYEVQDIILPSAETGKITQIIGRVDDMIILPDGTRVVRLGGPFKGLDEIKFAQIIQESHDNLQINIVPSSYYTHESIPKIKERLEGYLGTEVGLQINLIEEDQLVKTERGKYKLVINRLFEKQ
jgi:phenylacetate-CoA ligase